MAGELTIGKVARQAGVNIQTVKVAGYQATVFEEGGRGKSKS